jgi:diguanylate cyclase (GGDEF)-like protein
VQTQQLPDIEAIERQAEEHRAALRLASEIEVQHLRTENEQLVHRARRDRLTGLLNRGAFEDALPAALEKARTELEPMALLLVDADHFKAVNDTHGHGVGDAVLEHLARLLDDNVRKRDEVYRFGGEEFAVIAPDCTRAAAETLATSLCEAIAAAPHEGEGVRIPLTVSIGVACAQWPGQPGEAGALVEYADQRLYEAKDAGRNTWRIDPPGAGVLARVRSLFKRRAK